MKSWSPFAVSNLNQFLSKTCILSIYFQHFIGFNSPINDIYKLQNWLLLKH